MPNSTSNRLSDIENDGYTIIENVMSAELMTRIRTELGPYCQVKYLGAITSKAYTRKGFMPCW